MKCAQDQNQSEKAIYKENIFKPIIIDAEENNFCSVAFSISYQIS